MKVQFSCIVLFVAAFLPPTLVAQDVGELLVLEKQFANSWINLIQSAEVKKEIGLDEGQILRIDALFQSAKTEYSDAEARASSTVAISPTHDEIYEAAHLEVVLTLTGEQRKRFRQIMWQQWMGRTTSVSMYRHPVFFREMGSRISAGAEISAKVDEEFHQYLEDYIALNNKYYQRLLESSDEKQKSELKGRVGEIWFGFDPKSLKKEKRDD